MLLWKDGGHTFSLDPCFQWDRNSFTVHHLFYPRGSGSASRGGLEKYWKSQRFRFQLCKGDSRTSIPQLLLDEYFDHTAFALHLAFLRLKGRYVAAYLPGQYITFCTHSIHASMLMCSYCREDRTANHAQVPTKLLTWTENCRFGAY